VTSNSSRNYTVQWPPPALLICPSLPGPAAALVTALRGCNTACDSAPTRKLCSRRPRFRRGNLGEEHAQRNTEGERGDTLLCGITSAQICQQTPSQRLAKLSKRSTQLNQLHDNTMHALLALLLRIFAANDRCWHKTTRQR